MDAPPSSVSYLRAVQELQKKTDELERVFSEARRLEREKAAIADEKAALVQRVAELEGESRARRAEFAELEAQVVRQQQHLQKYIEKEVLDSRERGARLRDSKPSAEAVSAAKAEAKFEAERASLQRELASLRAELRAAKSASSDDAAMGAIEARALAGVKDELTAFAAENASLLDALEAERRRGAALAAEAAAAQDLLRRQRDTGARQLAIAQAEVRALGAQGDAMLGDLRRAHSARPARRGTDRGTITTAAPAARPAADAELRAVLEALVDTQREMAGAAARARRQMRAAEAPLDANDAAAPLPLSSYANAATSTHSGPLIDAIFARIAGIRHTGAAVEALGTAHIEAMQRQRQSYEQLIRDGEQKVQRICMQKEAEQRKKRRDISPPSQFHEEPLLNTMSVDGHNSGFRRNQKPLQTAMNIEDIGSWASTRERNLQCQLKESTGAVSEALQYRIKSPYQSGETLAEAASKVYSQPTRPRRYEATS